MRPPANFDLYGLAEAMFRRSAGKGGGAVEVLAHRDQGFVLFETSSSRLATFTVSPVAAMCW